MAMFGVVRDPRFVDALLPLVATNRCGGASIIARRHQQNQDHILDALPQFGSRARTFLIILAQILTMIGVVRDPRIVDAVLPLVATTRCGGASIIAIRHQQTQLHILDALTPGQVIVVLPRLQNRMRFYSQTTSKAQSFKPLQLLEYYLFCI